MKKTEIFSTIGHLIGLSNHLLLNIHSINLFLFCLMSFIPPVVFGINGYLNKDRAFMIGQIGWVIIAAIGIYKNI